MRRKICIGTFLLVTASLSCWLQAASISSAARSPLAPDHVSSRLIQTNVEVELTHHEWVSVSVASMEVAHESNGPEGAPGIPMQRASTKQIILTVGVMLACWGLLSFDKRPGLYRNPLK
jgi:hypothetical protein